LIAQTGTHSGEPFVESASVVGRENGSGRNKASHRERGGHVRFMTSSFG
jgi:hypothetical protein